MKMGIKQGYTFELICSYKFERGKDVFKAYVEDLYNIKRNSTNPVERNIAKLMLNSLYGRFGMKDIKSTIKIINNREHEMKINKYYNYSILSELKNGSKLIKYTGRIDERIRKLIKYLEDDSLNNLKQDNSLNELKGFNKSRGVPSAVQIAAFISANAKISINEFKNIEGNNCIYSDTDSVVLEKELSNNYIGNEIGQMKLEQKIKSGVFARKKLYAIINENDKLIIKASGADKNKLTYQDILNISKGESIVTYKKCFRTS
jgi:hypothetical protein